MTVRDMQIEFERSIQLIDENFVLKDKLDTENMLYFLNVAQERYLKETYLSKTSLQENVQFLQKRADDLKQLVERSVSGREADGTVDTYVNLMGAGAPGPPAETADGGQILYLPYDYIYYMLSRSKVTRDTVAVASADWTSNKVITHDELDNIIQTPFNDPILRKPCVLFEDATSVVIYSDSDTTLSDFELIYIRKPKNLLLITYSEITGGPAVAPAVGEYTVVSDVATFDGGPLNIGDTFTGDGVKLFTAGTCALSHLAFGTNTCELADYTHQEIIDLAVKIFIEEVKYKLLPNERAQRVAQTQAR